MPSTRVNRSGFLQTLETVRPGLSTKPTVQQASSFVFDGGWVITFNDEVSCRRKSGLPADFYGAVPADPLCRALQATATDDVDLRVSDGELQVKGSGEAFGVRLESEVVLPVDSIDKPDEWSPLPKDFDEAVKSVCDVSGTNAEEFLTVCANLTPKWMEATDKIQVVRYGITLPISESFLVRQSSLKHLAAIQPSRVSETGDWLHFETAGKTGKMFYSCRRHRYDDYPDIGPSLKFRGTPAVFPRGAADVTALAAVFSGEDKDSDKVDIDLKPGWMCVRGRASYGWGYKELKAGYDGPPVAFRITPAMLAHVIGKGNECEIFDDGTRKRLRIDGERWTYVTGLASPQPKRDEAADPDPPPDADPEPEGDEQEG